MGTALAQPNGLPRPVTHADFIPFDDAQAKLGQLLFYDPLLSGNRNISCGTCHHHDHASGDGLALGLGEGGIGVGPKRRAGSGANRVERRVPRNAPALFNLGARDVRFLFHDGRLSRDDIYGNGFNSPAEEYLPKGLNSIVAAQALFPIASATEMAGNVRENEVAGALNDRIDRAWDIVVARIRAVPQYRRRFAAAFDDVDVGHDIEIRHLGNAIGAFVTAEWRSHDSLFDRYLAGDRSALARAQMRGLELFYGSGRCATCHRGKFFTDHGFRALALPQFGPGRTRRFDPSARDVGRMGETDRLQDAYRFRTPTLRNVALTGPYGHNGAYATLEGIIRHHLKPIEALNAWDRRQVFLPAAPWLAGTDFIAHEDRLEQARLRARTDIEPVDLTSGEIRDLVAFLAALTGQRSVRGRLGRPNSVPSGLKVD